MGFAPDPAAALHQRPSPPHPHSHPSLPSSPPPSLPPSLARSHHPQPPPSPHTSSHSHTHTYYPFPPQAGHMVMDGVPTLPLVPGPHPPHTTTHQMLTPPLQDYTAWGRLTSSYPFHHLDAAAAAAAAAASSHFHDSLRADMSMSETTASQRLPQAHLGTLHFPSTHLQQQQHHHHQARRSPTNHIMGQGVPSTLASDLTLTQDPTTTMMAHANGEMLAAHLAAVQGNTNTGASLGHSLDGSPSWSSATMTQPMQLLEEYYMPPQQQQQQHAQAQAQRQAQAEHQARVRHQQLSRGPPPPPDSSRAPHNSHSSIGGAPTPPTMAHPSHPHPQAHRYSLELRRQQEEQLHMLRQAQQRQQQQEQQQAVAERSRRKSAEEAYLQQLAAAYGHPSPHTHTQAAHGDHLYMAYTDGAGHPGLPGGGEEVYRLHGHPGMLEQGYRLVDGAPGPLDLMGVPGVPAQENSPVGMLRYESPLPLE